MACGERWTPNVGSTRNLEDHVIYPLNPSTTAVLVIDVQEEYFDPEGPAYFPESAQRLDAINQLIAGATTAGAHVVYVRHAHAPDGSDVGRMADFDEDDAEDSFIEGTERVALHAGLTVTTEPIVITKNRYDSFLGTDLVATLLGKGIEAVVLVGYMTSFCIDATARGAQGRDFATIVVADAIGGPDLERLDGSDYPSDDVRLDVLAALGNGIAEILEADEVLDRLGVAAG